MIIPQFHAFLFQSIPDYTAVLMKNTTTYILKNSHFSRFTLSYISPGASQRSSGGFAFKRINFTDFHVFLENKSAIRFFKIVPDFFKNQKNSQKLDFFENI